MSSVANGPAEAPSKHSLRLRQIGQRDTGPELIVRSVLTELGAHFRTHSETLPGRPDVSNQSEGWAVMVHGCFWHGHDCAHGRTESKTNSEFWRDKIAGNRERDHRKRSELERLGFLVEDVWECELDNLPKLKVRLQQFLIAARGRNESFSFDQANMIAYRKVFLGNDRIRTTHLKSEHHSSELPPADAFDLAWLQTSQSPRASRNGAGVITCADLFSGCGGLSLGIREACEASGRHFRSLLAMESNRNALAVYKANFRPELTIDYDLTRHIDGAIGAPLTSAERELLARMDRVDMLVAGPPCQGHSNLNNHTRRDDERNDLYLRVARFAEIAEPRWLIIENVATVVHDIRGSKAQARDTLDRRGYYCDEATVDLSRIGVPQLRKRHVLVASLHGAIDIATLVATHKHLKPRSIDWAIGDLADAPADSSLDAPRKLSEENQKRIDWLFENGVYDLPNHLRPICHHGVHTYYAMYGRLRPEFPANTITTGFGSPGQGRYIHPTRRRTLTAHEAARLQMFPDFFDFTAADSYKALAKMIGNAVPMKLSYLLTLALLRQ